MCQHVVAENCRVPKCPPTWFLAILARAETLAILWILTSSQVSPHLALGVFCRILSYPLVSCRIVSCRILPCPAVFCNIIIIPSSSEACRLSCRSRRGHFFLTWELLYPLYSLLSAFHTQLLGGLQTFLSVETWSFLFNLGAVLSSVFSAFSISSYLSIVLGLVLLRNSRTVSRRISSLERMHPIF